MYCYVHILVVTVMAMLIGLLVEVTTVMNGDDGTGVNSEWWLVIGQVPQSDPMFSWVPKTNNSTVF